MENRCFKCQRRQALGLCDRAAAEQRHSSIFDTAETEAAARQLRIGLVSRSLATRSSMQGRRQPPSSRLEKVQTKQALVHTSALDDTVFFFSVDAERVDLTANIGCSHQRNRRGGERCGSERVLQSCVGSEFRMAVVFSERMSDGARSALWSFLSNGVRKHRDPHSGEIHWHSEAIKGRTGSMSLAAWRAEADKRRKRRSPS